LVVTHNFDDALEVAIDLDPSDAAPSSRRYHSFWRPEPFLRRGVVNIYHPNGFTPLRQGVRGSESLVLTEASFADHLANTNTEESHFLLRHFADKTCLIVGHSLSDGTLKNALRQQANQRPGHVHYYVHWNRRGETDLGNDQRNAIREANFETYNLVTIFADSLEIAEIMRMISMEEGELEGLLAHHSMVSRYVYYIVGAVSSGKSTTLRHLRNLATIEEWPGNMPPVMNRPSIGLKKTEESKIDAQLEDAIWRKNCEVRDIKTGIVAVDRAPLDFIAFPAKKKETLGVTARKRGNRVLERLEPTNLRHLCAGQVIVLRADPEVLVERQLQRGRVKPQEVADGSARRYLEHQRGLLAMIYKKAIDAGSLVETDRCTIAVSVKTAARIIHLDAYMPFDFARRLRAIRKGK
jgi:SIR2-like domain